MLSPDSLTMAQNKIQAIQDWPEPRKVWDIMSFLGFANFYCHFIYGYSEITVLFMWLTQKDVLWDFSDDCRKSFEKLKEAFTTALVLTQCCCWLEVEAEIRTGIQHIISNMYFNGDSTLRPQWDRGCERA